MNLDNQTPYAKLGPYLIYFTLGKGGFAEVKIAKEQGTDQICAIKIFKNNLNLQVIRQEAEIMDLVQHKNVPTLIDWATSELYVEENGQQGEVAFIAMEYLSNGSLSYYLNALREGFSEDIARSLFKSLIETLEEIHSQGIVHKDLKPDNLLFDENFNLKIGDFGIAAYFKNEQGNIRLRDKSRTESYAAPEISLENSYDGPPVDIFSCGVILFEMVVGRKPFKKAIPDEDLSYKMIAIKRAEYFWEPREKVLKRTFSVQFKELINSMLAWNPKERLTFKRSPWFQGSVLNPEEMKASMKGLKKQIAERKEKAAQQEAHKMEEEKGI